MASDEQKARAYDALTAADSRNTIDVSVEQKADRWDRRAAKHRRRAGSSITVSRVPWHDDDQKDEDA